MTREESWQAEGATLALLKLISWHGYVVSVHRNSGSLYGRVPAFVEMHATPTCDEHVYIARGEDEYAAAMELAKLVAMS